MFITLNDTIIRKNVRNLGGEPLPYNTKVFTFNKHRLPTD